MNHSDLGTLVHAHKWRHTAILAHTCIQLLLPVWSLRRSLFMASSSSSFPRLPLCYVDLLARKALVGISLSLSFPVFTSVYPSLSPSLSLSLSLQCSPTPTLTEQLEKIWFLDRTLPGIRTQQYKVELVVVAGEDGMMSSLHTQTHDTVITAQVRPSQTEGTLRL